VNVVEQIIKKYINWMRISSINDPLHHKQDNNWFNYGVLGIAGYKSKYCAGTMKQAYPIGYLDLKKPHLIDEWNLLHFLGHYFLLCKKTEEGKLFC
jgi:hypothetical protein